MTWREGCTLIFVLTAIVVVSFTLEVGWFPFIQDTLSYREAKECLAITFAGGIYLWAMSAGQTIRCVNPWLTILVGYILFHPFSSPPYTLDLFHMNVAGFWEFKPVLYSFIYFGLFSVVACLRLERHHYEIIFSTLMWIGFISALYVFLQKFNLDEFQKLYATQQAEYTTNGRLTATFTHPNYSAAFIAMTIPFALHCRRWLKAGTMFVAVILINSKMAMAMMLVGCGYLSLRTTLKMTFIAAIGIVCGLLGWFAVHPTTVFDQFADNGRFGLWHQVIDGIIHPWISEKTFPLHGYGLGAYRYLWVPVHPLAMTEVHNEWIQFTFDAGLIGVGLLIYSIFWLIKRLCIFTIKDVQTITLIACFLGILSGTCGLFLWQIEPHRFVTVVIAALLHNKLILKREGTDEKVA